jgi:hypothetical protein
MTLACQVGYFQCLKMKRFIDSNSAASTKSELDLFSIPATQVAVKRTFTDVVHTANPVTNEGPYEFRIPADPNFVHLSKHYVYFQLRIVRANGQNLVAQGNDADPAVAPINAIGKTFFKQAKMYLNSRLVYDSGDTYHLKSFLETELNYGHDAKSSHLTACLYNSESGANMDTADNEGFIERAALFGKSAWIEVMAPLHVDLMTQDRYLLPHTDVRIELHRNSDPLLLLCYQQNAQAYKLEVREMKMFVRKVEILESIQLALESTFAQYAAKYPLRRAVVTSLHVTQQRRVTPMNSLFQGQIPRRLIVACCDQDAFHGVISKSPFRFQNYSIQSIKVTAGGHTFPAHPMKLDFPNGHYLQAYAELFEALGLANDNKGNTITRNAFPQSHCIFAFDLTADGDDGAHWDPIKEGNTSLEIQFGQNLPAGGVQVIVYAEFDNLLSIDRNRVAHFDYTA